MNDLDLSRHGHVAMLEVRRPPNNFLTFDLLAGMASLLEELDGDPSCRAVVLSAQGKHFCAGSDLGGRAERAVQTPSQLYREAGRIVRARKPIVAAINGAAIGAGLGLALVADFRVGCSETRLSANFARQGYHHGFGLSFTLPRLVGAQKAAWMLYSGERIGGEEALAVGLLDRLVPFERLSEVALAMAEEIATSGPLAVVETRSTLRAGFEGEFIAAVERESSVQDVLRRTEDFKEGVRAMTERRTPVFTGR